MRAELYWIPDTAPGRLATMPRPRGGDWLEDEVQALRFEGVTTVVSLLTSGEERELDLTGEQAACAARGVAFISLPVPDRGVPGDQRDVLDIARRARDLLDAGTDVAIHCRAGIGRASLLAACVLVLGGAGATGMGGGVRAGAPAQGKLTVGRRLADSRLADDSP